MSDSDPGVEAWKRHTSAFDRVRSVAQTVSEPRSAAWIADEAAVSENTARDHLERLVEMNVLLEYGGDGATTYAPDPLHSRLQAVRELLDEYDHDGLLALKADLQDRIEGWKTEYGVESPDALRAAAASADSADETGEIRNAANEWELVDHRLGVVEDAIRNYAAYRDSDAVTA